MEEDSLQKATPIQKIQTSIECQKYRINETSQQLNPASIRELVITCIAGKNYVLPFEYVNVRLEDQLAESINSFRCQRRLANEQYNIPSMHPLNDIVNLFFTPVEDENRIQRNDHCTNFSIEKCQVFNEETKIRETKGNTNNAELVNYVPMKSAKALKIDRTPFKCPVTCCGDFLSVAFLSSHLKVEHSRIPKEEINPKQPRRIVLDHRLNKIGENHCNLVYYLKTTFRDCAIMGNKNIIPILVMSSKFTFSGLMNSSLPVPAGQHYYMFWITGIVSEMLKIQYSLSIGAKQWQNGYILPLGSSNDLKSVYRSGVGMIISQTHIDQLVRDTNELLEMQLVLS